MDFVHDQLATGPKLWILTVLDTFSRFSPVLDPRFSCRGEDVRARIPSNQRSVWTRARTLSQCLIEE